MPLLIMVFYRLYFFPLSDRGILKIIIIQKVVGMITMRTTMQTHIIMEVQLDNEF